MTGEAEVLGSCVRLFAITDAARFPDFLERSRELCARASPGTVAVVLRERGAEVRQQLLWARALREITRSSGQKLFVADRVDLAIVVGADGVHLSASGLSPRHIASVPALEVSRSGHGLEALNDRDWARLSAVWISPIFEARKGRSALGESGFRERSAWIRGQSIRIRCYALGGVRSSDASRALEAGATGVAAIGSVWDAGESVRLVESLGILR